MVSVHDVIVLGFGVNLEASMFGLPPVDGRREKFAATDGAFALAGGSYNFTVGATRLGIKVNLLAIIGRHDYAGLDLAAALEHEAEREGFFAHAIRAKDASSFAFVAHHKDEEREIYSYKGRVVDWPAQTIETLTRNEGGHIRLATSLRAEEWSLARRFFDQPATGQERPLRVLGVNPWLLEEPRYYSSYFQGVEYVFLNEFEAATLLGLPEGTFHYPRTVDPRTLANTFATSATLRGVVITCAQRGAILIHWDDSRKELVKVVQDSFAVPGPVVDETGAGDAVMVGFLTALLKNHSHGDCLASGVATASLKIRRKGGSSMPIAAEVNAVLNQHYRADQAV